MTVAVSMRIISTSQPSTGSGDAPQQQSLRGLHLPSSVADVSAAANSVNATQTGASGAAGPSGLPAGGSSPAPASANGSAALQANPNAAVTANSNTGGAQ